jgi:hypothetical protein
MQLFTLLKRQNLATLRGSSRPFHTDRRSVSNASFIQNYQSEAAADFAAARLSICVDWTRGNIRLIHGDCNTAELPPATAVATDPPYGRKDTHHYTASMRRAARWKPIVGDDQPFDPEPWLRYPKVVLWGYQCFADRLPQGTILVWYKKQPEWKPFLSDAELAWQKGGRGVYVFRDLTEIQSVDNSFIRLRNRSNCGNGFSAG